MLLRSGGIDVFYIDESNDKTLFAVTAIAIPFMRFVDERWVINWPDYLDGAKAWRAAIANELKIPRSKELHAWKLVSARGNYLYGNRQLKKSYAMAT